MRRAEDYQATQQYPLFKGYLDHFNSISIDNEIPGMLSFFFIQGQIAVPYVRIPWGSTHLDPRVHSFWIQSSRSFNRCFPCLVHQCCHASCCRFHCAFLVSYF